MNKHNDGLYEHHEKIRIALEHMHNDLEDTKKVAIDNSNKLDVLLNTAINAVGFHNK